MLLGIDPGTSSAKALLLATDGTVIREASSSYPVHAPHPGWVESNPADWWSAVAIAVRKAVEHRSEQVQAIGLSGQMHGVVLLDGLSQPLRPAILLADTRSSTMLDAYRSLDAGFQKRLGNPITAGMAGPSFWWLREQEPAIYAEARSDASGTLLYDVGSDNWAEEVLEALNLRRDWLPKIVPSHARGLPDT